jgi:hypothetical protein
MVSPLLHSKAGATHEKRGRHQWKANVVVGAGQKAPAIEDAMPADGTIVAAYCRERRFRHIPFERQLSDARCPS